MAYDAARARVILFGGYRTGPVDDTWEWDGTTWVEHELTPHPTARYQHAMAYDAARGRLLVVGGNPLDITASWQLQSSSTVPAEDCLGAGDADDDGKSGCGDPDCWALCRPLCPPGAPCDDDLPRCGDGSCNSFLETAASCAEDCP